MKIRVMTVLASCLVLLKTDADPVSNDSANNLNSSPKIKATHQKTPAGSPDSKGTGTGADSIVVRGWEIKSVSAMTKADVKEVFPEYKQKKAFGIVTNTLPPLKGTFLIVLVQCQSANSQPLNEPLWIGRPDVTLVDEVGFEYEPVGKLIQQGADYFEPGMVLGRTGKGHRSPAVISNVLVYFDVPTTGQAFWLRFADNPTMFPVNRLAQLPDAGGD